MPPAHLPDFIDLQTAIARKPVIVVATTTVRDAIARMGARQASCVLVMAGNTSPRKLLGILTAGDVVRLRAQELASHPRLDIDSAPIQTVMSQPVVTVNLADLSHWQTTLALFQQARVHHLPVLNDHDRVVGVLTQDAVTERLMPALLSPSPVLGDTEPGEELALGQLNHELQLTLEELQVVEEELRMQNLLLESERLKYEDLFKFAPEGYLVTDSLGVIQSANQAIAEMFGVSASLLIDKPLVLFVAPDDRSSLYGQLNQRLLHDRKQTWEITLQPRQGTPFPVEVTVVPIANPTKSLMDLRWLMRDIRDRKQAEALLANQNAVLERIAKAEPLSAILDHLLRTMELQLVNAWCSVMRLDLEGRLRGVAAPQLPEAYMQAIDGIAIGEGVGSCGTAAFRRDTVIVSDIATHPFWQNAKELALAHGLRACWSLPILANDGQVLGTFAIYHGEPHFPEAQELAVAARAANIAGIAMEREQSTQALQQLNQELEQRVAARTAALQASEERWQLVLKGSNDGIWDWDVLTDRVFFSSRWKMMRGFAEDEIGDQRSLWSEGIHPEDYDRVLAAVDTHFSGATEFFEEEYRVRRKDGTYFWILDRAQALRDASGQVIRMSGSETDITLRKQAEAALRKSEQRYRSLMDGASDAIILADGQGNLIEANRSAEILLGYSREQLTRLHMSQLHPPEALAAARQHFQTVIQENLGPPLESWVLRQDGSQVPVDITASRIDIDGELIAQGIFRDSSDRKQAELENIRLNERLHFVLASSPAAIYTCRTDGDYGTTFMSDNIYDITGHAAAEFMDESSFWADRLHPEDTPHVFANLAQLFEQGHHTHEYRFRHHAGHYVWIQDGLRLVRDAQGQPLEIVGYCADISDRKQAELENQRLKERLQFVLSSSPAVIFTCRADDDYETTFMSDNIFAMTGYTPAQFMHEPGFWADRLHPEDAPLVFANLAKVVEQESCVHEYRFRHHDGHYLWIQDGLRLVRDAQGQPLEFVGYSVDVSDRKAIEQQLQLTQYSVDHAADGILWINSEARFVYGNQAICQMLGYSLDELLQLTVADIDPDYPPAVCQAMWDQHHHNPTTEFGFETRHQAKDGRIYPVEIVGSYHQVAGKTLKFTRVRDISDRKQAEEALRLSEIRFRNAFDNTAVGMALVSADGRYLQVNAALCTFLDYSEAELLQLTFQQLSHPADLETDLELAQQVLAGARQSYHIEKRYITKPGQIVWGLLSISLIRDSQEQPLYFVSQIQDISDRKESEQRLEQTNAELMRATRLKDEFLANMSHELRTPLNAILGMAQGLQESIFGTSSEKQLHAYRIIESSGSHLLSLINDILDIAKIEAGQSNLEFAHTSISHLCQSSLVFVKQQALRKNIRIELRQPTPLPNLWADERRIRQVLINLLNNAVKFTPEGGRIILEVSSQVIHDRPNPGNWIQFSVTDTGIGIAPENIAKLFQPFIQIDGALNRKYTGTGLGLALVKNLVELHGGWVDLTSELGQGSCFMFSLPGTAPTPAHLALSTPKTTPDTTPGEPDSNQPAALPPLVLLTEDHDATIVTVSSYLKAKGYRILVAKHGQAAIALTKAHRPDIILMDIQMPGSDGLTATREIRQDPDLAHIPIIALTALAMDEDRDRCIAAGATAYLAKPIQLKQLTNMIEQCLNA